MRHEREGEARAVCWGNALSTGKEESGFHLPPSVESSLGGKTRGVQAFPLFEQQTTSVETAWNELFFFILRSFPRGKGTTNPPLDADLMAFNYCIT